MLNDQTKSLIAEFFFTLAKGETIIESIRQNLNSYPDFDPFLLYNRLDSARKNFLTEENIINFTKLKNIACSLNQARYLILFYDSTGTQNITYNEFLNLVLNKNYYHQNRMTTTNIENENDNYLSYETEEKFLELLNEEINLIIALDQILSNIKSFGDFSVNELMNMIGSNGKVIEKKIYAFLQNYGKNLNEDEIKNLLRILDLKRNGKVDTQDLDRIFYFPYTTPPPFKNNNNVINSSNFNNSNLSNSNNNLNINIENNNNIPNNFPPKSNNFSLKGSFNQNFNNSQQFNNNQPFNKNRFFTNPNPCNDSNYTNFRHNVSPQPFQPKKKINQSLYSSQSTKFNSSMNNNSNKFRQQFYSPPQRNNYVPFNKNLNINIQNSNFNKRNQFYDPCKDPCYDPCKDPCVNVNNNYDPCANINNYDPCKDPCYDPCKDPCVNVNNNYDPCKDPCYDPCKDLINNNNNIISSSVNNNYINNNNNYYDPCQEVYDPCKDIINNNNINNNYYVNNQMNKNFNQSGYKNINNSNISFNTSNQTNYSRNNRFFGNPNEFPIRVSKTLALRLSPQRKVKNQNNSFSNEYDNQMNMNNSINNNMNMNSFSQQQNTFTQNDFNNFIQLIMHYETLIECKKLELACNYPDYNVEDLFSLFESPQTQNDILSFQDLRNGFCNLGFNISNEDLNIFIKRYNLECVNGISYSDFFDIVVPFDKIKRDEIENRNDNILTNQTVEKFKELIDLIFTAERAIEDERIRINNLNGFNLGLVFNGERKFEGNCANDDDLEDFLKRKGISFDQKGADLLFIRLYRNRYGCVGVCDFCYEF